MVYTSEKLISAFCVSFFRMKLKVEETHRKWLAKARKLTKKSEMFLLISILYRIA